jgi:hypothetical protein
MMSFGTNTRHRLFLAILMALVWLQVLSCGTSDTGGDGTRANLTGSWELTSTRTSNTCGIENGEPEVATIYLRDSADVVTITTFGGPWGDGIIRGSEMQLSGTEISDDFGCPATLETEGSATISSSTISGTLMTTVSFDQDSCPGTPDCEITTDIVMTKLEDCDCLDRAVFDDPETSDYVLPFPVGSSYPVYQSYCFPAGGHRCQLAYDFKIPIGDPVVTARGGVVREVKEDSPDDGEGVGEHNFVYIEHDDGTAAFYAHLMQNSVTAMPGDTLVAGEQFASSGNSGYSGEPHLHFGVYEAYPAAEGHDTPVNFRNTDGPLDARGGLIRGEFYTALPY